MRYQVWTSRFLPIYIHTYLFVRVPMVRATIDFCPKIWQFQNVHSKNIKLLDRVHTITHSNDFEKTLAVQLLLADVHQSEDVDEKGTLINSNRCYRTEESRVLRRHAKSVWPRMEWNCEFFPMNSNTKKHVATRIKGGAGQVTQKKEKIVCL